ncbi:cleavage and polyadenylation specificity factor (CPSF) A subunit protein [Actinidia rufa]|uniref:Cleavage and polyadenylation specificity factor (CPSF) A subunit protein n=1 Tax=Actinidia rufa TaxID=165716 RepID=A0A7J0FYC0_9ERIC|nr:cleavage and polyadenylation specificity factor (CPSF) A subunit protein [Actinidia rufa]
MRGRSYSPSPPRGGDSRRRRSPSPRGRYGGRGRDLPTSLLAVHVISQYAEAGPLAHDVVEVPHSYGFAILFRVGDALLMDLRDVHNPSCVYRMTLPASVEEHNFVEADEIFNVAASALLELGDVRKDDDPMSIDGESGNGKSNSSYKSYSKHAPILDMSVMDYHDEKHDPVFACCGKAPEGSLRIIRSGISVEKLLRTAPIYQGMTGTWTLKMKVTDSYHSFLVLSFVEQTRVLSVGLSFTDVTDMVGFQPDVCTLACGLVGDGLLAQIHQNAVRLCLPTAAAQADGIPSSSPICTSWSPDNISISLGAVGHNLIVVSTSSPSFLFILGVRYLSACHYEAYEMQHISLQNELSCMSIPHKHFKQKLSTSCSNMVDKSLVDTLPDGVDIGSTFVIGAISLTNTMRTAISGCVPQDVRLVLVDRLYVLSGLRNGMLLRFEWPTASTISSFVSSSQRPCSSSCLLTPDAFLLKATGPHIHALGLSEKAKDNPVHLQLIAIRRIGITPAFLIPLSDALDADVIALSDRPWLLHTARHSLSYTSISFQPSSTRHSCLFC